MKATSPKTDTAAVEQFAGTFESDIASSDRTRAEALEELHQVRDAWTSYLQRARLRLANRLGEDHPRVLALDAVVAANQQLTSAVKLEVDRANTGSVEADERSWILHGYVRNSRLQGQPNLTVAICDRAGKWVQELGYACTDENGYFKLRYQKASRHADEAKAAGAPPEMRIQVSDRKKHILTTDRNPVEIEPGQVDYREVVINGADASCGPPSDVKSTRQPALSPSSDSPSKPSKSSSRRKSRPRTKPS
jgi:hypothetical protein